MAVAAQPSFQKLPGPNEYVKGVAIASNGDYYAAVSAFWGVFKSTDSGSHWSNISSGLPDSSIRTIAISSNNEVFAGTLTHGMYRYTGGVWSAVNNGLPAATAANIIVAGQGGVVYIGTVTGLVYKWNGTIWSNITANLAAPNLAALAIGPTGTLYAGDYGTGVFKYNGSSTWSSFGTLANNNTSALTVNSGDTVFAVSNNTVYRIPSSGGVWSALGLSAQTITAMAIDPQGRVFVGGLNSIPLGQGGYGAIYRSLDRGASWSMVSSQLFTTAFWCFAFGASGDILTGASGVYKSSDNGTSWKDINRTFEARRDCYYFTSTPNGHLFFGTLSNGVWRSIDSGNTWEMKTVGITKIKTQSLSSDAAGDVFFGGYLTQAGNALYRSSDEGNTWTTALSGNEHYYRVVQHNADTLWSCQGFEHPSIFSYSADNGAHWVVDSSLHAGQGFDITWRPGGTVFAGTETGQLSRSLNYGHTWTQDIANGAGAWANVLSVETDRNGYLFTGTTGGGGNLYFGTPASNGNVMTQFSGFLLYTGGIRDIAFDSANNAFVATNAGLFMANSTIWSSTTPWNALSNGLPPAPYFCFNTGFDNRGYLYVSVVDGAGGGLFRTSVPVNNVHVKVPTVNSIQKNALDFTIAPNPVVNSALIHFAQTTRDDALIKVFRANGQLLAQQKAANAQDITIDTHLLPPGVFFVQLVSQGGTSVRTFAK